MILINIKNYKIGSQVLDLVRTIDIYCNKASIAVPATELKEITKNTTLPVYLQHLDFHEQGRSTGFVIPEAAQAAGAQGSIINHAEHPISFKSIKATTQRCHELGLKVIICVANIPELKKIIPLKPYAIAFEDPELIGTGKAISTTKPELLKEFIKLMAESPSISLCGAGITSGQDVAQALVMGCKGVLVSSVVANSQHPEKFLKEVSELF